MNLRKLGAALLLLMSLSALFAPFVAPYPYEQQRISERVQGPSPKHWMGTDSLGRDIYSRIVYGGRASLGVGFLSAVVALLLGTLAGCLAGFRGGRADTLFIFMADLLTIFPGPLLAILLMLVFGRGFVGLLVGLSFTSWISQARVIRGQVMQIRELPYIEAARAMGVSSWGIISRHILPNLTETLAVTLSIQVPTNILTESFLSFIGLGLQPPYASWGTLANEGFRGMISYPHLIVFPSLALFLTMMAFESLALGNKNLKNI